MNDPEFKELVNKFFLVAIGILIFLIPIFLIFYNRYKSSDDSILNSIRKEKTFILYITGNNCSNCKQIRKGLRNIKYREISENNNDYELIINELGVNNITPPSLMYIKKGKLDSYIVDIKEVEEVEEFINQNKR